MYGFAGTARCAAALLGCDMVKQCSHKAIHALLLLGGVAVSIQTHKDSVKEGQRGEGIPVKNWYQRIHLLNVQPQLDQQLQQAWEPLAHAPRSSEQAPAQHKLVQSQSKWTDSHATLLQAPNKVLYGANRFISPAFQLRSRNILGKCCSGSPAPCQSGNEASATSLSKPVHSQAAGQPGAETLTHSARARCTCMRTPAQPRMVPPLCR